MMFEIRLANSQNELDALFGFRYKIYVEEMMRIEPNADHVKKTIQDDLDINSHNLLAFKDDVIVGAIRINLNKYCSDYYLDFYQVMKQCGVNNKNTSVITKLMVASEYRKSTLTYKMFIACYNFGLANGIRYNFMDCQDHLVDFYKSFGYEHYIGRRDHIDYGETNPLKLDLHDEAHFRKINCPFLKPYLNWKANTNVALQALI